MALPKLENPTYTLELPSNGREIKYRPFLVKEQKVLLIAQESEDAKVISKAMKDIVSSCTFGEVDVNQSPLFDIEYVFLKLRAKSVGETVTVNVLCPDDGQTRIPVTINLEDVDVHMVDGHTREFPITDTVTIKMKYPQIADVSMLTTKKNQIANVMQIMTKCIDEITFGDDVYKAVDLGKKELDEFVDSMNSEQIEKVVEFFNTMPKLRHEVEITNPKTEVTSRVIVEGSENFLG